MSSSAYHIPVLPEASLTGLGIGTRQHGLFVDATFGGGGHTRLMLDRLDDRSSIYGFDQDPDALANVPQDARFQLIPENFRFMRNFLRLAGWDSSRFGRVLSSIRPSRTWLFHSRRSAFGHAHESQRREERCRPDCGLLAGGVDSDLPTIR